MDRADRRRLQGLGQFPRGRLPVDVVSRCRRSTSPGSFLGSGESVPLPRERDRHAYRSQARGKSGALRGGAALCVTRSTAGLRWGRSRPGVATTVISTGPCGTSTASSRVRSARTHIRPWLRSLHRRHPAAPGRGSRSGTGRVRGYAHGTPPVAGGARSTDRQDLFDLQVAEVMIKSLRMALISHPRWPSFPAGYGNFRKSRY